MTSSSTIVTIANRALLSIGARATIEAINEGSTESDAVSVLFNPTFEMLARTANWNCLRNQEVLSLLAAAQGTPENPNGDPPLPPVPWLYQYALPEDNLKIRFIVPSFPAAALGTTPLTTASVTAADWFPGQVQIPYQVAYTVDADNNPENVLLTNQSQAQVVYTVNQPNPVIWDSLFEQAMVSSLAAFLVPALSLNIPLMGMSIKTADAIIAQARGADGNEGVTCMDHIPDWITARYGDGAGNRYGGANLYNNFINMAWPVFG